MANEKVSKRTAEQIAFQVLKQTKADFIQTQTVAFRSCFSFTCKSFVYDRMQAKSCLILFSNSRLRQEFIDCLWTFVFSCAIDVQNLWFFNCIEENWITWLYWTVDHPPSPHSWIQFIAFWIHPYPHYSQVVKGLSYIQSIQKLKTAWSTSVRDSRLPSNGCFRNPDNAVI